MNSLIEETDFLGQFPAASSYCKLRLVLGTSEVSEYFNQSLTSTRFKYHSLMKLHTAKIPLQTIGLSIIQNLSSHTVLCSAN